jgi:hypothetical protein
MVRESGMPLSEAVFETAKLCVDWPYVWSAWGEYCTPANRKKRNTRPDEHPTIVSACQVLSGKKSSCSGCKWYPGGLCVRMYDCRGFTSWCLKQYGISITGSIVSSQWNGDNWRAKGEISSIPDDLLVCLFEKKDGKWIHTGLGYRGASCECQKGVQYFAKRDKKWTHWAVPKGIDGKLPDVKPTLRRGDKGEYVTLLQTKLLTRGYDIGSSGVDSKYGKCTENAVRAFQRDNGLAVDGVTGPKTWAALDEVSPTLYTVTIPHLSKSKADELVKEYVGATMTEEGGR